MGMRRFGVDHSPMSSLQTCIIAAAITQMQRKRIVKVPLLSHLRLSFNLLGNTTQLPFSNKASVLILT